ncbi:VHS1020 protein [Vibrio phage 1]|nr:VHS1020 protein [Vibrio phage 1]
MKTFSLHLAARNVATTYIPTEYREQALVLARLNEIAPGVTKFEPVKSNRPSIMEWKSQPYAPAFWIQVEAPTLKQALYKARNLFKAGTNEAKYFDCVVLQSAWAWKLALIDVVVHGGSNKG